jgi:3'-phosphoadenosine 5'-phosphosulfate sulfotransferase (PAPS reductase)/FAD synthetase
MVDPFRISGRALLSFSTGKTSGYMLWRTLQAHGGQLPTDVIVGFENTGKERRESLEFGAEVQRRWGVPIVVIERPPGGGFRVVTWETANMDGEPFAALIEERQMLPNPVMRFCSSELKIRTMRNYLRSLGWEDDTWTNIIGLRADEPKRVARVRDRNKEGKWDISVPLYDAGITKADVDSFWRGQPFSLQLNPWEGNCDLCFLKGVTKRQRVIEDHPEMAAWWIAQEHKLRTVAGTAALFRQDTPSYARLYDVTTRQLRLVPTEQADDCNLGDIDDCQCGDWTNSNAGELTP